MLFATPLPNVFGGALLYLTSAALLTGRTRLAVYASIATAFIHVQLGTMTAVLLAIMAGVAWRRHRESVRALALGALISGAVVVVALQTRPVAGHLSDFAEVCDTLIPYHCEATTWTRAYLLGGGSLVVFALLTYFFLPVSQRWRAVRCRRMPTLPRATAEPRE